MSKNDFENASLVGIVGVSYLVNLAFSVAGYVAPESGAAQLLLFQVGNAFAITGSVMAGRYTGSRGQHVAASGYILLGITHGISLAALSRASISVDRGMTMAMPMIPALVAMFWCSLYPRWVRLMALAPIALFTLVYVNVQLGRSYFGWPLVVGYGSLQTLEVIWAVYLWRDFKQPPRKVA